MACNSCFTGCGTTDCCSHCRSCWDCPTLPAQYYWHHLQENGNVGTFPCKLYSRLVCCWRWLMTLMMMADDTDDEDGTDDDLISGTRSTISHTPFAKDTSVTISPFAAVHGSACCVLGPQSTLLGYLSITKDTRKHECHAFWKLTLHAAMEEMRQRRGMVGDLEHLQFWQVLCISTPTTDAAIVLLLLHQLHTVLRLQGSEKSTAHIIATCQFGGWCQKKGAQKVAATPAGLRQLCSRTKKACNCSLFKSLICVQWSYFPTQTHVDPYMPYKVIGDDLGLSTGLWIIHYKGVLCIVIKTTYGVIWTAMHNTLS